MNDNSVKADRILAGTGIQENILKDPGTAHVVLDQNRILGMNTVPGLEIDANELDEGMEASITVKENTVIEKTVHLCFGVIPERGVQRIIMDLKIEPNASISVLSHCVFPNAVDVRHIMKGTIDIAEGGRYSYLEKHVHSEGGGVKVYPEAEISVGKHARFSSVFELITGRVGLIDIDYHAACQAESVMEMTARISGRGDDIIKINERGHLLGEKARGVLKSNIAVRDNATAEIENTLIADAPYARGHVDCKEIVRDRGTARAVPIVEVLHPKAHITHEAAIGSVDSKQLETLLARGMPEDDAVELIIQGMLS
jgi:hypothetical protein